MKICIFSHTFPRFPGDNIAPFIGNLARSIANMDHEVYVLIPYDPKIKNNSLEKYKIITYKYIFPENLHVLGYSRTFKESKNLTLITYFLAPFLYIFGFIALVKLIRKTKVDIISVHWLIPGGFISRLVRLITKVPYVVTIPGADVRMGVANEIFRWMAGFSSMGADYVISDSAHYIHQLNSLGFSPRHISIIPYGVDIHFFKPKKKNIKILNNLSLKKTDKIILAVGRMVIQKGFIYLVKAFPEIIASVPNARIIFIGEGYEKNKLQDEIKKLKIEKYIFFVGSVAHDKLVEYYNASDVFVMPSIQDKEGNTDASPVALMEAMSCGVRVIATKFSASNDFLDGKTGILVKQKNSKEIAEAAIKLLYAEESRSATQIRVRKVSKKNFSLKTISKKYVAIFESI